MESIVAGPIASMGEIAAAADAMRDMTPIPRQEVRVEQAQSPTRRAGLPPVSQRPSREQ
jgi:hypothetical protein